MDSVNILKDVIAYVEVRSNNDNRSAAVCRELEVLGAKVETSFTDDVTHVVYKEGLKRTYIKAQKKGIPLVSVSWLESCKRNQKKMPEMDFIPLVEKEPDNPLIKMKQNRRWKKMKSMQPCDFDEEVARSAERNKKQRRRVELANRFKLSDDATPPGGSPALILAPETQARSSSPFLNASRFSSPFSSVIPDTPATPTMKERIEKMMREQRNVIGAVDESPKSSVLETAMLQRKLFEKLAKDIFSVEGSDEEDDGGETTARVVAKLIGDLGDSSCASPATSHGAKSEADHQDSDDKELESIFNSVSPISMKSNLDKSPDARNNKGNSPGKLTLKSGRKSLVCRKENGTKTGAELVREARHSTGSSSDESFVLSPMCSNKIAPLNAAPGLTEPTIDSERNFVNRTSNIEVTASEADTNLEASGSKPMDKGVSGDGTPKSSKAVRKTEGQPRKPKTVNKRKLFTDPMFSMAVLPVESKDGLSNESPEAPSSNANVLTLGDRPQFTKNKRKRNTEAAEVSFLFNSGTGTDKGVEKDAVTTRRSKRLSMNNLPSPLSTRSIEGKDKGDSLPGTNKLLCKKESNVSSSNINTNNTRQTRRSLGTSMSVLYGTDMTVLNSSTDCPSRRSIDGFSTTALNRNTKRNLTQNKKNRVISKSQKKKGMNINKDSLQINTTENPHSMKQMQSESESGVSPPPKKRKTSNTDTLLSVKQEDSDSRAGSGSGSDTTSDRLSSPTSLRHASSLIMESTAGRRHLSLVMTSLHRDEQDVVKSVVKKLGVFKLIDNVDMSTTHVVCGEARRTLNLLRGIAGGCWILRKEWVLKSLEAGTWLMEEDYEMAEEFPPVKECRSNRHALGKLYRADLFSHIGPIFVSSDCAPPRQDLVNLIMLCSGKVTKCKQRASLFLGMEHISGKTVVKPTWILDSIMKMSLQDPGEYVIPATSHRRENSPEF